MQRTRNLKLLIAMFVILALGLAAAIAATRDPGSAAPAVRIAPRSETTTEPDDVHVEVCPPYCGDAVPALTAAEVAAIGALVDVQALDDYLATLPPPPPPAPAPPPVVEASVDPAPAPVAPIATGGARSYAWWEAIATCESGNTNAWRTGYYGLEGGPGVTYGGLDKATQLSIAEGIYAQYGDSAWGCAPVAWGNVPSG